MQDPRKQFGPVAESYLTSGVHSNEASLARLIEIARPQGGTLLDVATGAGHTAFAFAPFAEHVVASDITTEMLAVAGRTAAERELRNIRLLYAYAEQLPLRSGTVEGVTCRIAAHHFQDAFRFVHEARRVLRPGGWLLLVDNVGLEDSESDDELDRIEFLRDPSHVRNLKESQWLGAFKAAGLEIEFQEVVPKPINARDWLRRMRVPEPTQEKIVAQIEESDGWLREYLRPHGSGELLTFHLHELSLLGRASPLSPR